MESYSICPTSLSMMSPRLIQVVAWQNLLPLKAEKQFIMCIYHHLFTHSSTNGPSTLGLLWISCYEHGRITKNTSKFLLSILLNIYTEAKLLDPVVSLYLVFWEISILSSTVATTFYISTNSAQRFQFLHIPVNTCNILGFFFFIVAFLMGVRWWYLAVVLICI